MSAIAHRRREIRQAIEDHGETLYEEIANTVVHGVAAVLSAAALALIVVLAALTDNAAAIVSCAIYGTTLFFLYLASALYHGIWHPRAKRWFLAMDHCAIFMLIAGTYTPIALVNFPPANGWALFGVIWGLAAIGITVRLWHGDLHWSLIPVFVGMGWLAFVWGDVLYSSMAPGGVWLLIAGGICYTGGIAFYAWRTLKFNHALWHGFVLAGSVCHFVAIAVYSLPRPTL